MLRIIYLHGALGRKFGYRHRYAVNSLPEAIMALSANNPRFKAYFYRGPAYSFVKGSTTRAGMPLAIEELPMQLGKHDVHIIPAARGSKSQKGAIGKIIIGVVLIAAAVMTAGAALGAAGAAAAAGEAAALTGTGFAGAATATGGGFAAAMGAAVLPGVPLLGAITYGGIASTGAMMALSGVAGLIASTPQANAQASNAFERPDARSSFIYNGPMNTVEQGGPVPVVYGRMVIGSTLMSSSVSTDQIEGAQAAGLPNTTARSAFSAESCRASTGQIVVYTLKRTFHSAISCTKRLSVGRELQPFRCVPARQHGSTGRAWARHGRPARGRRGVRTSDWPDDPR